MSWWQKHVYEARQPILHLRARVIREIRAVFEEQGFTEVETPILQVSPGVERHTRPVAAKVSGGGDAGQRQRYLHTSPEFGMKKLLAAGETKIFQICHVVRDGEVGRQHQPEFTMLEWYRAGATYLQLMSDVEQLVHAASAAAGVRHLRFGDSSWQEGTAWHRTAVSDAFKELAGIDVLATVGSGEPDTDALRAATREAGMRVGDQDTWDDIFHRVMLEKVGPDLAGKGAAFLYDYPTPVGALARRSESESRVCERVEAYVCGVELANGFSELTDAAEQRQRFESDRAQFAERYGAPPPIDEEFLKALDAMPPSAGMALGIDRLIMLLTGAPDVASVQWVPLDLSQ